MDEVQDASQEGKEVDNSREEVIDAPQDEEQGISSESQAASKSDPIKARLGRQEKRHQRELRSMQEQIVHLHGMLKDTYDKNASVQPSPGQPMPPTMSEEERIQHAVRLALQSKDEESRRAREAESAAHLKRQYDRLHEKFDSAHDRYEDFDEVVRGHDAPFTNTMQDALLLVDNPVDVAYKLGKNRQELSRISQLHPLDQIREINKLSFALMGGTGGKQSQDSSKSNPLAPMKQNPASSPSGKNMSASTIRARMKAGTWK